ncbi:TPA: ABC transporter ATP-binding protein, partial [Candidatus Bathyarchaeota archaeon]|nr:ABC transporter ATP-binding protein [Candidatus Bathyarchaeota archaeon]
MGWHHHPHFGVGKTERKTPSKVLIARLLRYFLPHKMLIGVILLSIVATSITGVLTPYLLGKEIISRYILRADLAGLWKMILAFIGVMLIGWAASAIRTYSVGKIGQSMLFNMRSELFSQLQNLSFSFFDKANSGDIISRVTNDTDSIGEVFTSGAVSVISDILSMSLVILVMFAINVQLTLVSLLIIPLIIGVAFLFNSKFREAYMATRTQISKVTSRLEQSLAGIREIKSFTKERDAIREFREANLQNF